MKLFDRLFGKSEKIKVQFIDSTNGSIVGVSQMMPEQLHETFAIETTMSISGSQWLVKDAVPANAVDFIKTKSLILKLEKIESIDVNNLLYSIPTISNEFPAFSEHTLFNDFETTISNDDWRQYEFLYPQALPLIDIELDKITHVIENHSRQISEDMVAFAKCHVRDIIGEPALNINFTKLKELLGVSEVGSLRIAGSDGFVLNSFSLTTTSSVFYGACLKEDSVTHLCINSFSENTITEIEKINKCFGVLFVNWYQCEVISSNA